jgi:muconolactone delta-isomerase
MNHTYTTRIRVEHHAGYAAGTCEQSYGSYNSRQGAISYLWPFYKGRVGEYRTYTVCIIVDRGTVNERRLYPPEF